ncbi:AimR family lysis-lysogeny pheromone receptor [Rossellomorea marisflavi]|uniref:AimR family lysis-lysogeny pheromone receptor n=1 Tax=Rossellomorea marisflavi TaxID=189381 RepID=UPI0039BF2083
MRKIFHYLENICESREISNERIANLLGMTPGSVSNYFHNKQEIKFVSFLKLIEFLVDDESKRLELIYEFCKTQKQHIESDRVALEWASNNGQLELQRILLEKMKNNKTNGPHTEPYDILFDRNFRKKSSFETFLRVKNLMKKKYRRPETRALLEICFIYSHWDQGIYNYSFFEASAKSVRAELDLITSEDTQFIKDSFEIRIREILANAYLKAGNVQGARDISYSILRYDNLHWFPAAVLSTYRVLAESYLFTDKEQSLLYLNKAISMLANSPLQKNEAKRQGVEATADHIRIHLGEVEKLFLHGCPEKAHYLASIGQKESALKILSEIELKNGKLTAHQQYYKALAHRDNNMLKLAQVSFYKESDFFYAQLPEFTEFYS